MEVTRKCTKCLATKPLTQFYSKGNRCSSECKSCKKSYKKAKYVAINSQNSFAGLKRLIELFTEFEKHSLDQKIKQFNTIIEGRNPRNGELYV